MGSGPQISKLKVMSSMAGYYIGRTYYDADAGAELPYDRRSVEYYNTAEEAKSALETGTFTYRPWD